MCDAKLIELGMKGVEDMQENTLQAGFGGGGVNFDRRQWRVGQQVSKPGRESLIAGWKPLFGHGVDGAIRCR